MIKVDHLDNQVQIYDLRRTNFDRQPVMAFGYRDGNQSIGSRHRYRKGSTSYSLFARGYSDGMLCLFDYRNTAVRLSLAHLIFLHGPDSGLRQNVVSKRRTREDPIVHAVLTENQVIAYGSFRVTFWPIHES